MRNKTYLTALAACLAIGVSSAGAQKYSVTDLGVLPGKKENVSTPAAINNAGQVAGTSGPSAFRFTNEMEDIGRTTPGSISRGFGINLSGQVVGDATFGFKSESFRHAATFSNGSTTDLGTLGEEWPFSRANGINASGDVVGSSNETLDSQDGKAFIVNLNNDTGMIDLGTLGGEYAQARSINDSGFVTGYSQIGEKSEASHAFVWQARTGMLDLGVLGGEYSYGMFINANNHVVGYSTIDKYNDRVHAFLHNGKVMIDLGSLGGASADMDYSYALGINSRDQVVGYTYLPSDGPWPVAFVYSKGLMTNLNDQIGDASSNYRLDWATAINDQGQIVAIAYINSAEAFHAVLLTPNSDPASMAAADGAGTKMVITRATYSVTYSMLTVHVTYAAGDAGTMPSVLNVYGSAGNELIGTLKTKNGSNYFGSFTPKGNPEKIWVGDNTGQRADAEVVATK